MLKAINNIFSNNSDKAYSTLSFDEVNIIKTLISTLLGIVGSCETKDMIHISNFIASDDDLIEVIVLIFNSKGSMYICIYTYMQV